MRVLRRDKAVGIMSSVDWRPRFIVPSKFRVASSSAEKFWVLWQTAYEASPLRFRLLRSGDDAADDVSIDVRQTEIASGIAVGEACVIET